MLSDLHPPKIKPIEREFEAWVVRGIQDYFALRGLQVVVFAFSPHYEKNYPADHIADLPHMDKGFALQFKKPLGTRYGCSWKLDDDQFDRIKRLKSIFYCLPTFVNREDHKSALQHALFWHPAWASPWLGEPILLKRNAAGSVMRARFRQSKGNVWGSHIQFTHSKADEKNGLEFGRTLRWGAFIENAERCFIGLEISKFQDEINQYIDLMRRANRAKKKGGASPAQSTPPTSDTLYVVLLRLKK